MKTIYKTNESKNATLELYNSQITKLGYPYKDIYVNTSFGETHLIETGNLNSKPLLMFYGGNSTTAYNLLACRFFLVLFMAWLPFESEIAKASEDLVLKIKEDLSRLAKKIDCSKPPCIGIKTKFIFSIMKTTHAKSWDLSPGEKEYWEERGWLASFLM